MLGSLSHVHNRNVLGAGLRREFPGAFEWIGGMRRRVPPLQLARAGTVWAVLAGLGANQLFMVTFGGLLGIMLSFIALPRDWQSLFAARGNAIAFIGGALGAAVALRSGGWRALLGFAGTVAAFELVNAMVAAPGQALFCERSGGAPLDLCARRTGLEEILARWPLIAGLAAGPLVARRLRQGRGGSNASLEAVGLVFAGSQAVRLAAMPFLPPLGEGVTAGYVMVTTTLSLAVALLAGHLIVRRGGRPWPTAVLLALLVFAVPWIPSLIFYARYAANGPLPESVWLNVIPVAYVSVFVLASIVTAAFAPPRPPDADATRRAAR